MLCTERHGSLSLKEVPVIFTVVVVLALVALLIWDHSAKQAPPSPASRTGTNDSLTGTSPKVTETFVSRWVTPPYGPPRPKVLRTVVDRQVVEWFATKVPDDLDWVALLVDLVDAHHESCSAKLEFSEFVGDWPKLIDRGEAEVERRTLRYARMLDMVARWEGSPMGTTPEAVKATFSEKYVALEMDAQGLGQSFWDEFYKGS